MMGDVEVTPAPVERVPAIVEMYGRAFLDEPLLRWPLGMAPNPRAAIEAEFRGTHTLAARQHCLWEVGDAAGAAVWISPDAAESYWEKLLAWPDGIAAHAADGGRRHVMQWEWVVAHQPDGPMWFLDSIAVDPERQRGGIGSALISHGLDAADRSGFPAVLETSQSHLVRYYEAFGFNVVREGDVPEGGPHVWFMQRPPEHLSRPLLRC
jgi:GNAT superfamily N-acetyltransferase